MYICTYIIYIYVYIYIYIYIYSFMFTHIYINTFTKAKSPQMNGSLGQEVASVRGGLERVGRGGWGGARVKGGGVGSSQKKIVGSGGEGGGGGPLPARTFPVSTVFPLSNPSYMCVRVCICGCVRVGAYVWVRMCVNVCAICFTICSLTPPQCH